jgi:hypothetical protein
MVVEESSLFDKAVLLMELRGYEEENIQRSDDIINIEVSNSNDDEKVLLHIVTDSKLKSGGIGSDQVTAIKEMLEEKDVDKIIVFSKKITKSARNELNKVGIEFFSIEENIISSQNPEDVYIRIQNMVNNICTIKCGKIPKKESECKGYSKHETMCKKCEGEGKQKYSRYKCSTCHGTGYLKDRYTCEARLISDNSDFHLERQWINLLKQDLIDLVNIRRTLLKMSSSKNS